MKNGMKAELAMMNGRGAGAGAPAGNKPIGGPKPMRSKVSARERKRGNRLSCEKTSSLSDVSPGVEMTKPGDCAATAIIVVAREKTEARRTWRTSRAPEPK